MDSPSTHTPPPQPSTTPRASDTKYWQSDTKLFPRAVQEAIEDGLDPNKIWTEDEMLQSRSRGGCVVHAMTPQWKAWFHWNTPFHRAMWLEDFETAAFLLEAGADINLRNAYGHTALHEAVSCYKKDAASFLVKHQADVEAYTQDAQVSWDSDGCEVSGKAGQSPLHLALSGGDVAMMKLLLDHGARPGGACEDGWTLLDLALIAEDGRAMALLSTHDVPFSTYSQETPESLPGPKATAQKLLAVATSNLLQPPAELHQVYCHVLSRCARSDLLLTLETAHDLMEEFFDILYEMAEVEKKAPAKDLCTHCSEVQSQLRHYYGGEESGFEYELHQDRRQLERSVSEGCLLCSILSDALKHAELKVKSKEEDPTASNSPEDKSPVRIHFKGTELKTTAFVDSQLRVQCGKVEKSIPIETFDQDVVPAFSLHDDSTLGSGSNREFWMARKWIERCKTSPTHAACQKLSIETQETQEHPSRLLDIGDEQTSPHVVEEVSPSMRYLALSYCNGPSSDALKTTRANLEKHREGIASEDLPVAFRDAILVAKELGYQYIWIDALCIVQDDEQDWAYEVSRLHTTFLGADVTISSLTARSSSDNLLAPRSDPMLCPVPLKIWQSKRERLWWRSDVVYCHTLMRNWMEDDGVEMEGPVHTRGWTLPEQLLSPKMVYFGRGMLHWECPCSYATEVDPTGTGSSGRLMAFSTSAHNRTDTKRVIRGLAVDDDYSGCHSSPNQVWQNQVEAFTRRKLTKASDRLPAFWAFSKYMEKHLGCEFLGGIWGGDKLLESLCWISMSPATAAPLLPSWTWTSTAEEVTFQHLDRAGRDQGTISLASLLSHDIKVDPVSFQVSGTITLKGTLCPAQTIKESVDPEQLAGGFYYIFDYCDLKLEDCSAFDAVGFKIQFPPEEDEDPALSIRHPLTKVMLLLKQDGHAAGYYRRVGAAVFQRAPWDITDESPPLWVEDERSFKDVITLV